MTASGFSFLQAPANEVAPRLLGAILEREINGLTLRARIVETEAYDEVDPASHSYRGETPKNATLFGAPGHLYVYAIYGIHYCCNIAVGPAGRGAGVLIRAVEPVAGVADMARRRPGHAGPALTNGPAKLCQALSIDKTLSGHDLRIPPLRLIPADPLPSNQIVQTTRIGINQAQDALRRFYIRDNPYVSKQ